MSAKKEREKRRQERVQKESESAERARRDRLLKLGSAAAFLAIVAVAVLIVVSQSDSDGGDTDLEGVEQADSKLGGISQQNLVLGDPGAEVTLYEFGDLQCPACKSFAEDVIPEVIDSKIRSGEAKLVFRNFTIIGPESEIAAEAAVAAGEQGRGWSFIELFYENQGFENAGYVTAEFLRSLAKGAGVPDLAQWNRDRRSDAASSQVSRETAEAERLGLSGTPSFAVQGPATNGLETVEAADAGALEEAIEQAG